MNSHGSKMRERLKSERGIYLVASLIILTALVLLVILIVGLGFKSGDKIILKNHANLLALAGIEGFVNAPGGLTYSQKADAGKTRANSILARNTLKAIDETVGIGTLDHAGSPGPAGEIEFGQWFEKAPPGLDPCGGTVTGTWYRGTPLPGGRYPCFRRNPVPASALSTLGANAARVKVKNQAGNPISPPIVGNLGTIEEESFAIMVPRCLANLMDLSYSTVAETHKASVPPGGFRITNPGPGDPFYGDPYVTGCDVPTPCPTDPTPQTAGLFAFPRAIQYVSGGPWEPTTLSTGDCSNLTNYFDNDPTNPTKSYSKRFYSSLYWCRMPPSRPGTATHFQGDYELEDRPAHFGGPVMVDKVVEPQPFTRFLSAMNAALRLIKITANQGDRAMLGGFAGAQTGDSTFISRVPGVRPDDEDDVDLGLTNEIDYLVQLTNPNNIYNRPSKVYPNFININLFPIFSKHDFDSNTNLIAPIYYAARAIADVNNCAETAQRSIIMATDGIATCRLTSTTAPLEDTVDNNVFECKSDDFTYYENQETTMHGQLRNYLRDRKISFSVIIDSEAVGAHIKNIFDSGLGAYLDVEQARARGYGINIDMTNPADPEHLFDITPNCNGPCAAGRAGQEEAYIGVNRGRAGYKFPRPLATLGKLALETGGIICPLMRQCTPADCPSCGLSCYDGDGKLKNCARGGPIQTCALIDRSKSEQAAICAAKAVGGNPFALREPVFVANP